MKFIAQDTLFRFA